jgi:hypothetical protein
MNLIDTLPYAIAGAVALGAGGYYLHCQHVKKDHEQFVAQLKADAEAQRRGIEAKIARDRALKEDTDAKLQVAVTDLRAARQRLRDDRARASSVPPAPTASGSPHLACFDRAELGRAVDNLEAGVEDLVGEGAEAALILDAARGWARALEQERDSDD